MTNRQRIIKLEAHVETILDLLLDAEAKWAVLHPILVNRPLIGVVGGGYRARGLDIVRRALMQSCVQDIAQIAFDPYDGSPSISKVIADLGDPSTVKLLRKKYLNIYVGPKTDPAYSDKRLSDATSKFENALKVAQIQWKELSTSPELKAFKKFRDMQLAHVELSYSNGKYHRLNVSKLGIKWKDIGLTLLRLESTIMALNTVVRGAWINMADSREQFEQNSSMFWSRPDLPPDAFTSDEGPRFG
jgi:hypothetical protein